MISVDRMKHILGVAKKMRDIVLSNPDSFGCTPEEAYTLGFVHDIGYAFAEPIEHAKIGGDILKTQGYQHWKEVSLHGLVLEEKYSSLLDLLNYADMTTGPSGEEMSLQERIDDISVRYGKNSLQAEAAKKIGEQLIQQFNLFSPEKQSKVG